MIYNSRDELITINRYGSLILAELPDGLVHGRPDQARAHAARQVPGRRPGADRRSLQRYGVSPRRAGLDTGELWKPLGNKGVK